MPKRKAPVPAGLSKDTAHVLDALNEQDDLAATLIGASWLDACVESLLRAFFIDCEVADRLLQPQGPLGTSAARTDAAYCLGLISPVVHKDLRTIAVIRNRFAHKHLVLDFNDTSVRDRCANLLLLDHLWGEVEGSFQEVLKEPRARFVVSVVLIGNKILAQGLGAERERRVELQDPAVAGKSLAFDA